VKKFSLVSIIVVLAMVLAACGGAGDDQSGNGAGDTRSTDTGSSIVTEEVGGGLGNEGAATQDLSGGMATEEVPSLNSTEAGSLPTESTGALGTSVPNTGSNGTSVPNTGNGSQFGEFARLGDLIGMRLSGMNTDNSAGAGNNASATQEPTMESTSTTGSDANATEQPTMESPTASSDSNAGSGANGSNMGAIQDFVINVAKARVDYIVVDRGGQSILVPWSTLAFNRDNGSGFTFNGQNGVFDNAPVFSANDFDFSSQNWDAGVLNAWRNGGITTNNGGVVVATGQPGVGSISGTAVPTMDAGGQLSATQQSTATVGSNDVHNGPVFSNDMVAVLYTDLVSKQVVQGNSSDNVNDNNGVNSGSTGNQLATQSPLSTGEANATPAASSNTGSDVQSGQAVGQIVDAVVNVTTGDVPYLLLSTSGDFASNNTSGSGSDASATAQPSMEATNSGSANAQPTMEATAGSGSNAGSSSGNAMGSANVDGTIPVPMRFFRFQEDSIVLVFPANMLSGAPVYNSSDYNGPLNFGWDTTFQTFWTQNGGMTNP